MGKYMTFLFDTEALRKLIEKNPDYVLVNVGYRLIPNPDDPSRQVAQLTVDAQACAKTKTTVTGAMDTTGTGSVLDTVNGCPVPPCVAP